MSLGDAGSEGDEEFLGRLALHLKETLPPGFAPKHLSCVGGWPLAPWGALDRGRLPRPEPKGMLSAKGKKPRTFGELCLFSALRGVLKGETDLSEDFRALGGDSLDAQKLSYLLQSCFGWGPEALWILAAPSLSALAGELECGLRASGRDIFRMPGEGEGEALAFVPGISGSLLCFRRLMEAAEGKRPVYALSPWAMQGMSKGPGGPSSPFSSFSASAAAAASSFSGLEGGGRAGSLEREAEALAGAFPKGGFALISEGYKSLHAWELASELYKSRGIAPSLFVALDAIAPGAEGPFQGPSEKGLSAILESLYDLEGAAPKRADAKTAFVAEELRGWAAAKPQKLPFKALSIRSKEGMDPEAFPLSCQPMPLEKLSGGGFSEAVFEGGHPRLFEKEAAERILGLVLGRDG
jgi:hypothetical protein